MGTKISALPPASALTGFEVFPAVQSLADVGATANQLKTFVLAALATVASSGSAADLASGTLAAARLPAFVGDVSSSAGSASLAIGANRVTRAMLAQATGAAFIGAAAAGNVSDLTVAQAKTLLALASADIALPINNQSASYTAAAVDQNGWVRFTGAGAQVLTIPPNSSVAFPVGTEISFSQAGAGGVTIAAGAGVTINSRGGLVSLAGQYGVGAVKQVAANLWTLTGDLA